MNPSDSGFDIPRPIEAEGNPAFRVAAGTVASERHPDTNEDAFFNVQRGETVIAGVFDGVGGFMGGEDASTVARNHILQELGGLSNAVHSDEARRVVERALRGADKAVKGLNPKHREDGPASTASVAVICQSSKRFGEQEIIIGNVGDSRVLRLRGGYLECLTTDDNWDQRVSGAEFRARRIQEKLSEAKSSSDLTTDEERYAFHARNQITQALGAGIWPYGQTMWSEVDPHITWSDVKPGDVYLLASDGITDNLTASEIRNILLDPEVRGKPNLAIEKLKAKTIERSCDGSMRSKKDDMTGIVIEVGGETPRKVEAQPKTQEAPKTKQFELEDPVKILRHGATEPEAGWKVMGQPDSEGRVLVIKEEGDKALTRHVRVSDLEEWNKPPEAQGLNATSRDELYKSLTGIEGLQGSGKFYSSADLRALAELALNDPTPENANLLTRAGGFREAVLRLAQIEKTRRDINRNS